MYTIRILNAQNPIFEIVTNIDGLFPILSLLGMNSLTQFQVFSGGVFCQPSQLGFGNMPGWVSKFDYKKK